MRFHKYQGLGNDFILLDARPDETVGALTPERVIALCDRRFGIGADGVLVVARAPRVTAAMQVHNADGSRAENCGNGLRCVARYLWDLGGEREQPLWLLAGATRVQARAVGDEVAVEMGAAVDLGIRSVEVAGRQVSGRCIDLGNPHFVLDGVFSRDALETLGAALQEHPAFPGGVNVSAVTPVGPAHLSLRVWERGAGLTLACGTGACASVAAAWLASGVAGSPTMVDLPGGRLVISGSTDALTMRGPAEYVFSGDIG